MHLVRPGVQILWRLSEVLLVLFLSKLLFPDRDPLQETTSDQE